MLKPEISNKQYQIVFQNITILILRYEASHTVNCGERLHSEAESLVMNAVNRIMNEVFFLLEQNPEIAVLLRLSKGGLFTELVVARVMHSHVIRQMVGDTS